jgi:hypothetical protein
MALVVLLPEAAQAQARRHGISMHGEPALPPGFSHLPFVNPEAPKGGRIVFGQQGTFDSLNAFVVRGVAPDAAQRFVLQSLLYRSPDEPFTAYGLIAREIEMPEDRGFIVFHLDPRARFSDGMPVTAADVQFSFDMLRTHGKPFHRSSLGRVQRVETPDPLTIRFVFGPTADRETPLIIGSIPIFAKHATNPETFPETTFTPPVGSGPYLITDLKPGKWDLSFAVETALKWGQAAVSFVVFHHEAYTCDIESYRGMDSFLVSVNFERTELGEPARPVVVGLLEESHQSRAPDFHKAVQGTEHQARRVLLVPGGFLMELARCDRLADPYWHLDQLKLRCYRDASRKVIAVVFDSAAESSSRPTHQPQPRMKGGKVYMFPDSKTRH